MPNGAIEPNFDYFTWLANVKGRSWPTLAKAREEAVSVRAFLTGELRQYVSDDVDIVVFGSLTRREWTSGSDIDWTMLVDGQADPEHRIAARAIQDKLAHIEYKNRSLPGPGAEGIFGTMVFGHDIVHNIGGQSDTNRNTTQRIFAAARGSRLARAQWRTWGPVNESFARS